MTTNQLEQLREDINECYPVKADGLTVILLNDKIYYNDNTFNDWDEFCSRMDLKDCTYNKNTYDIKYVSNKDDEDV